MLYKDLHNTRLSINSTKFKSKNFFVRSLALDSNVSYNFSHYLCSVIISSSSATRMFQFSLCEMFNNDVEYNHFGRYLRCRNAWHYINVSSNFKAFFTYFYTKESELTEQQPEYAWEI